MQKFHCLLLLSREGSRQLQASELVLFGDKGLPRDRYVCTGNSIHTHNARKTSPFCTAPDLPADLGKIGNLRNSVLVVFGGKALLCDRERCRNFTAYFYYRKRDLGNCKLQNWYCLETRAFLAIDMYAQEILYIHITRERPHHSAPH